MKLDYLMQFKIYNMERLSVLFQEINKLTLKIALKYPDWYEFLNENPITIPNSEHPQMNTENFADYLDSLKQLLYHAASLTHSKTT